MRFCIVALCLIFPSLTASAHAVTFDWATVGDIGNADDTHGDGYGGVDAIYRISMHEVTNAQYVEFLNAVASTDSFSVGGTLYDTQMGSALQGGITRSGSAGNYTYAVKSPAVGQGPNMSDYTYDNKPVVFVSFFDAMRFANWLHNGQGSGDTEIGVYNISDGVSETRSANAKFWIPSEDEWYKAAYFDPNGNGGSGAYYDYPTSSDTKPDNNLPSADTENSANFFFNLYTTGTSNYPMTDVGAYALSESPYGTFDQGGNVWEWNEAVNSLTTSRGLRGASWHLQNTDGLEAANRFFNSPSTSTTSIGFRVASIPEPSGLLGDFDMDNDVDGFDFLEWQRDPNIGLLSDWEANYGLPLSASSSAVPEPASLTLVIVGVLGAVGCRR